MKLFYRETGQGSPLIILHGLYGSSDNWVSFARGISEHFHLYLVDLRNHGQSPHHSEHTFLAMREDIKEFMNDHSIEKAIIMGHSMGGKTALFFAAEYPAMVQALIVLDISPRKYNIKNEADYRFLSHEDLIGAMLQLNPGRFMRREEIDLEASKMIRSERIRQFLLKNLKRNPAGKFEWKLNLQALYDNLPVLFEGIMKEEIKQGDYPVLFVRGSLSEYILEQDIEIINELFPNAEIKTIEGAGHWLHADKPEELKSVILNFLGKNDLTSYSW